MNQVSQSAASQHVQELEKSLAVPLIDRTRRPLRLTEAGRLYNELCRDVLRRHEEFANAIELLKTAVTGTVRVAAIFSVGLSDMTRVEQEFGERHPAASLEVAYMRPERIYSAVRNDAADLGMVSYPQPAKDIAVLPWREEEMVLATGPKHALARSGMVSATDLEGMEFVAFDPALPIRREVDRFFRESDVNVEVIMHFDSIPEVKEALALGNGVSILPARMLQSEIEQGRLVAVPLTPPGLVRPLGVIHLKRKHLTRAAQAFLSLLIH